MKANIIILILFLIGGLSFALTAFGPGTGLDCGAPTGTILIVTPGEYIGNGLPMSYDGTFSGSPVGRTCMEVWTSDVIIDCNAMPIYGSSLGPLSMGEIGIYIAPGMDNVTIRNCNIYDFGWAVGRNDVGNIFVDGATNVTIEDSELYYTGLSPGYGDQITYSNVPTSGLIVNNTLFSSVIGVSPPGTALSGIAARDILGGIQLAQIDNVTIESSTFENHDGSGVYITGDDINIVGSEFTGNVVWGVYLAGSDDYIFDNNFTDNYVGLDIEDGSSVEVISNVIEGNDYAGLYLEMVTDALIEDNEVYQNDMFAIMAYDLDTVTFRDNEVYDNTNNGIEVHVSAWGSNPDLVFDNNSIHDNGLQDGIYGEYLDYAIITNNTIYGNGDDGIYLYWSYGVNISNNYIYDNPDDGIRLDIWCDDSLVYENNIMGNSNGLYITEATNVEVYDNSITSNDDFLAAGVYIEDSDAIDIHDNLIGGNYYGVYADPTTNINVTNNTILGSTDNGIYFLQVYPSLIEENDIIFNGGDGIRIFNGDTSDIINNNISGNGFVTGIGSGITIVSTDFVTINDNEIGNNNGSGIDITDSAFAVMDPNYIFENGDEGIYLYNADNVRVTDNEIYDNDFRGLRLQFTDDGYFSGNTIYDNGGSGYWLVNSYDNELQRETLYSNGYGWNQYGIQGNGFQNLIINDTEVYDSWGGIYLYDVDNANITETMSYNNQWEGFSIVDSDNALLVDDEAYNDGARGYYFEGTSATVTDCTSHDHSTGVYGFGANGGIVTLDNFMIYGNDDSWIIVRGTVSATDLWMGYSETQGVLWPTVMLTGTDANEDNLLLERNFVSLNDSDIDVDELNTGAEVSVYAGGCDNLVFYEAAGFPLTRLDILSGTTFTPASSSCAGGTATFEVAGFSGYTASGSTDSGGDEALKQLSVTTETDCDGVEFTITNSGSPVTNVEIKLTQYTPFVGVIATKYTNSNGEITFDMPATATYRAYLSKAGYDYANPYVIHYTLCEEEPVGCTENSDCPTTKECIGGACVAVECECGVVQNHECVPYECCNDEDCAEGEVCTSNGCIIEEEQPPEELPPEEVTQEEAQDALDDASAAINAAEEAGKNVTAALEYYALAEEAFEAGDYKAAKEYAIQAMGAIGESLAPEESIETDKATQQEEEFPCITLFLVLAVVVGVAYLVLSRRGKKR
ncbi:right-handed parallel beta-helix repeat-containing protein [Candidatus Micrarchaeota archaeon]|nr:right-handed parallel beta-helix repeat-containing protein [Candidatus Micrarchaeota archaeon]